MPELGGLPAGLSEPELVLPGIGIGAAAFAVLLVRLGVLQALCFPFYWLLTPQSLLQKYDSLVEALGAVIVGAAPELVEVPGHLLSLASLSQLLDQEPS